VVEVPEGWSLGPFPEAPEATVTPARAADGAFTTDSVMSFRAGSGHGGMITGSTDSRQFQIFHGERPHIWAVAIGTRNLERAYSRCIERGISCTEPQVSPWSDGNIRFFFAEVGGIVFEVMRIEQPIA
jgi:hypothetical protein